MGKDEKRSFYEGVKKIKEILYGRPESKEAMNECLELITFFTDNAGEPYSINRRWMARMLLETIARNNYPTTLYDFGNVPIRVEQYRPDYERLKAWIFSRDPVPAAIRSVCEAIMRVHPCRGIDPWYYACDVLTVERSWVGIGHIYGQFIGWPDDATVLVFRECAEYIEMENAKAA